MTANAGFIDQEFPAAPSPAELDDQYASAPLENAVAQPVVPQTVAEAAAPAPAPVAAPTEQTPVVPDPPRSETERLEPDVTGPITLQSGKVVDVVPLKLRETMKLLKIVTRGAGAVLEQLMGDLDLNDPAAFAQTLGALVIMSIPEAENEAIEFIQAMVRPSGFNDLPVEEKVAQMNALVNELSNPDLEDVISIIERVIRRESEDIRSLGKRIGTAFSLNKKVQPKVPQNAAS